ncbi:MAG: hypothetical protein F4117_14370 [Acidimicrobiales bacterium]|nr:hypothetical protein [Acidimicrobiales bacterium]MXX42407.1 hypothetical protein [Acidimicrobiales bacterium]MYA25900.1 hypothetical protein [Acidimicrobiales bacterium]MYB83125.1 hypothetical protein [Acidimicrobiales bacterium]MYD34532.1 hypothetical protein [Acidimicrobiales bacterium]
MPDSEATTPEPPDESKGLFERLRASPGRPLLLIAVGLILVILFLRGGCSGVDISEGQAVNTARAALAAHPEAFEPERTEAKVLRQGFPPTPMWVVVFTVPDPEGGPEQFLHHAAVWVHAGTGELRQVDVSEPDDG